VGTPRAGVNADLAGFRRLSPITLETLRLFLHVLAATVWVGGQITLAALVPALRAAGTDVPRAAAHAFNRIAWPAFGILVLTGVWNVVAEGDKGPAYQGDVEVHAGRRIRRHGLHARSRGHTQGTGGFRRAHGLTALAACSLGSCCPNDWL
jgi:hypothetical protein